MFKFPFLSLKVLTKAGSYMQVLCKFLLHITGLILFFFNFIHLKVFPYIYNHNLLVTKITSTAQLQLQLQEQ